MKVLITVSLYRQLAAKIETALSQADRSSYAERLALVHSFGVASFDGAVSHYLSETGRYEVLNVFPALKGLQSQWAAENNYTYREDHWQEDILLAQLEKIQPEIWFSHAAIPSELRLLIRSRVPSVRLVLGYDGAMLHSPEEFAGCDVVVTCIEETAEFYRSRGIRSFYCPHGFDQRLLSKIEVRETRKVALFSGSVFMSGVYHFKRARLLHRLKSEINLHLAVNLSPATHADYARRLAGCLRRFDHVGAARLLSHYRIWRFLRRSVEPPVFGDEMLNLMANSLVTLNTHGDIQTAAVNMRLFEATGVGTCLLTDWHPNIDRFFEPDQEIVTYRSPDECAEKLRDLIADPERAKRIGAAGQKRCLAEHTMQRRVHGLESYIQGLLSV